MAPFKFPPPPPPPPKATANDSQDQYSSQRGGSNAPRGSRGRGGQSGGRGNSSRGNDRGGRGRGRGNQQHQGDSRGGSRGGFQRGGYSGQQPAIRQVSPPQYLPPPTQPGAPGQPAADPAVLAQAMAYMSTPAGVQTFTAFASTIAIGGQPPHIPQIPSAYPPQQPPPPQGNKRKRNENAPQRSPSQPKAKPQRVKAAPPPAVPSFGFALPPAPVSQPPLKANTANKHGDKKRKVNLGLTLGGSIAAAESSDEEEEEDIDEEEAFAKNPDFQAMSFEHNGVTISLQTPADISAWIKDRSKNFPTQRRAQEKAQEEAERRAGELEFLRKVTGKRKPGAQQKPETARPQQTMAELESLRNKVKESILAKRERPDTSNPNTEPIRGKRPPPIVNLGLGYDSDSDDSSVLSDSSVVSGSSEDDDSDEEPDAIEKPEANTVDAPPEEPEAGEDSDDAPEVLSTKVAPPPLVVPPPAPVRPIVDRKKRNEGRVCSAWQKYGNCKAGDRCRHAHPPKEPEKRLSLFERFVEQEQEATDRMALDAIKWLGQNGFLG